MSKTLGVKIGFAVTAFALLVSIIAFLMLDKSFAWFAKNETVTAQGMGISVRDEDVVSTMLSLGVFNIENDVYTFENARAAVEGGGTERVQKFDLPVNDPNGISYNQYRKALVLELSIQVKTDRPTQIRLVAATPDVSVAHDNFFSNCITVSNVSSYTENTVVKGDVTQSFVTQTGEGVEKTTELLLFDGTLSAGEPNKLYFIVEYNDVFLNHINYYILNNTPGYFDVEYAHDVSFVVS